jgi:hypothetical protein
VTRGRRKLHNEKIYNLYSSPEEGEKDGIYKTF